MASSKTDWPFSDTRVALGLLGLALLVYLPSLGDSFLADDFVNLDFARHPPWPWKAFFDPTRAWSDPVTRSRFKPGYVFYLRLLEALLGDRPAGYHALSVVLHGLGGFALYRVVRGLYPAGSEPLLASVLYVTARVNGQVVVWASASYRLASVLLALLALASLDGPRRRVSVALCVTLFALGLSMNPEVFVLWPALAALGLAERDHDRRRARLLASFACAPVALAFAYANHRASQVFYELPVETVPDWSRLLLYLGNLVVPFQLGLRWKCVAVGALLALALATRDRRLHGALLAVGAGALFWSVLTYPLTPRYLQLSSAFHAVVLARLFTVAGARLGRPRAAAAVLAAPWVLAGVAALEARDLPHFHYLSREGAGLLALRDEARRLGRPVTVRVLGRSTLDAQNRRFFHPELRFTEGPEAPERTVETGLPEALRRFGPGITRDYWFFPWFQDRLRW
ncbi:MAG: hypothetical protein HY909_02570 [Deltaproteobacteria bacterium]|nr:hypothetical protein [Deltaproteobacteria bacterium]